MYRIFSSGTAIECDSPQDVVALLAAFAPPAVAAPAKPKTTAKTRTPRTPTVSNASGDTSDAAARRDLLLSAITASDAGLTRGEIHARFPKMSEQDQRNGLQALKVKGQIRRAGNAWVVA